MDSAPNTAARPLPTLRTLRRVMQNESQTQMCIHHDQYPVLIVPIDRSTFLNHLLTSWIRVKSGLSILRLLLGSTSNFRLRRGPKL